MQERSAPSRPVRLGTRRRRAPQARAVSEAGASRLDEIEASSLDTDKQLATSVREWNLSQRTEGEIYAEQCVLQNQLKNSCHERWQHYYAKRDEKPESAFWWAEFERAKMLQEDETEAERQIRVNLWLRAHKPPCGAAAKALKWEKQWLQLHNCQRLWVGKTAECCGGGEVGYAVPVGCNHRMCPLCAWSRSKLARTRVKTMFDRLTHPALITLTVPNNPTIRKHDFTMLRQRVRQFIAQHPEILGGIYSLETTYNRQEKTWHVHVHVLADLAKALPTVRDPKVDFFGVESHAFTALKWRWEFDWLCLWGKSAWAKMPRLEHPKKGVKKWKQRWDDYLYYFQRWTEAKRAHSTLWAKRKVGKSWILRENLTAADLRKLAACTEWNRRNTRVIDVRPVIDREGAAKEVLKYITKAADFADIPEAVESFCDAVRGVRLVQTFGSWYSPGFDTDFDTKHLDDWSQPACACGLNMWKSAGVFTRSDMFMQADGRWMPKPHLKHRHGTMCRSTIRAGDAREEERDNTWQTRL